MDMNTDPSPGPTSSRPRTPLSNRLNSLLSGNAPDPSSDMRPPRPSSSLSSRSTKHGRHLSLPHLQSPPPMASEPSPAKGSAPIIRWLGSWRSSSSPTASSSGSQTPATPHSPQLDALEEALHEDILPHRPEAAHYPQHFHSSRNFAHMPPFLDNLTRSTMPTASLSPRQSMTGIDEVDPVPSHSPPTRSSVDTLRAVRDRGFSTSATSHIEPTRPASWWWFQNENKDHVDELLNEDDRGDTAEQEQSNIRDKYRTPKNPIVFCHGLLGFDSVTIGPAIAPMQVSHWRGIKEVLEAAGAEVLTTRVPATSSPLARARVLESLISAAYPGRSVHLIGHSMGGLDCRYLTTHLTQRTFRVLSITTIATPHRGSAFADHFLATVGEQRMGSVLSLLDLLPNGGGDGTAFESLTLESMRKFNEDVKDVEGVKYFSWGAIYEPGLIDTWKWPHSVILEKEGPNDGLVSVASSKWGTYLGTLEHVNHLDLVGWVNPARYKWAALTGREIKFRPATFYLGIADMLAREVEGQKDSDDEPTKVGRGVKTVEGKGSGGGHDIDEPVASGAQRTADDGPQDRSAKAAESQVTDSTPIATPSRDASPTPQSKPPSS